MSIKFRLILMNFLEFFVWGAWLISLGDYMFNVLHFDGRQVGSVYGTMGVASIFTPALFGIVADRWMNAERVLGICHIIGAAMLIWASTLTNFGLFYVAMLFNCFFFMPTIALNNTVSYILLVKRGFNVVKDFPPIRVWGTVGFVCAMWVVDLFGWKQSPYQLYVSAAAGLALGIYAFTLPACFPVRTGPKPSLYASLGLDAFVLFKRMKMFIFFLFSMLLGFALQISNAFASPFISDFAKVSQYAQSFGVRHTGLLISISQISETLFILTIPYFLRRFGIKRVILMSIFAWVFRFGLFGLGNPGSGLPFLVLSMIVYGMAFDFFNISGSLFVEREADIKIRASAQGLFMLMTNGIGAWLGTFLSGLVVDYYTHNGVRDWHSIWQIFALYALALGAVFPMVFRYKHVRLLIFVPAALLFLTSARRPGPAPYKDPHLSADRRVRDLLSRMTVDEKIRQLDMYWGKEVADMSGHEASEWSEQKTEASLGKEGAGSVHDLYPLTAAVSNRIQRYAMEKTRLGIPVLFIEEGLHGYSGLGSTSFPIPLELSGAWDTSLVYEVGRAIATETRAHGTDMLLAPVLCLPRDPRWGRTEETYGEDTYLDARNAVAMVRGMQGRGVDQPDAVIAEPKHFAVHGIPEAGSNAAPVNMGEREVRSAFLPVFEAAVREGGALGIMAAYSELDGIPCVDNKWLLTEVLRKEWGFRGFVLSDLGAIRMSMETHRVAASVPDALAQTVKAGLDMQFYDWPHAEFREAMKSALRQGLLSVSELDRAVGDVLRVKFMLGLFDHPYTDTTLRAKVLHSATHAQLALKAAQEGICLLKNDGGLLPLHAGVHRLAVVGPLAASTYPGGYSNPEATSVSILDGLRRRAGSSLEISYAAGYGPDISAGNGMVDSAAGVAKIDSAVGLVKNADAAVVVLGETPEIVGENKDRAHLGLDDCQMALIKAVCATGKPVIVLLSNGRPLCIDWVAGHVPAIVETWFSGEQAGLAIADVLLGRVNPSGKLPMTFPRSEGQIPYYYNYKPSSIHRYVDEKDTPLFPFGYGLSYTHFSYSGLKVTPGVIAADQTADVEVTVTNSGTVAGAEVVQLYDRQRVSSVTTPQRALKGFGRVMLDPGESRVVHFRLGPSQFALWNRVMKRVVEPGVFDIMVGSSSADIRLTDSLRIVARP